MEFNFSDPRCFILPLFVVSFWPWFPIDIYHAISLMKTSFNIPLLELTCPIFVLLLNLCFWLTFSHIDLFDEDIMSIGFDRTKKLDGTRKSNILQIFFLLIVKCCCLLLVLHLIIISWKLFYNYRSKHQWRLFLHQQKLFRKLWVLY